MLQTMGLQWSDFSIRLKRDNNSHQISQFQELIMEVDTITDTFRDNPEDQFLLFNNNNPANEILDKEIPNSLHIDLRDNIKKTEAKFKDLIKYFGISKSFNSHFISPTHKSVLRQSHPSQFH